MSIGGFDCSSPKRNGVNAGGGVLGIHTQAREQLKSGEDLARGMIVGK